MLKIYSFLAEKIKPRVYVSQADCLISIYKYIYNTH